MLLVDFYIDTWAGRKGSPYLDSAKVVSIVAHISFGSQVYHAEKLCQ
jgi:hypothetical protein